MESKEDGAEEKKKGATILMDASKRETHHAGNGFKKLFRRLRASGFKVLSNKEELSDRVLDGVDVLVLGAPRERFTPKELDDVKSFVANGEAA